MNIDEDNMVARLVAKLKQTMPNGNRTPVCIEARRLVSIHPELYKAPQYVKDRIGDRAIAVYFND